MKTALVSWPYDGARSTTLDRYECSSKKKDNDLHPIVGALPNAILGLCDLQSKGHVLFIRPLPRSLNVTLT